MKRITYIKTALAAVASACLFTACNDDFLEKYPETNITEKVFFQSASDLEAYTNSMIGALGVGTWDVASDNNVYISDSFVYQLMRGEVNEKLIGGWSNRWGGIRDVNFMLNRLGNVKGDKAKINHYIGLACMVRAIRYYSLVKSYSDVPWYSVDLQTTDKELLYKTQDDRTLVVDSIFSDLDFAVDNMLDIAGNTTYNKAIALAIRARTALHEGTFRKYHDELNLTDGDKYLEIAAASAKALMDNYDYTLSEESYDGLPAYQSLFCNTDLTKNNEVILCADYDKSLGRFNNVQSVFDWESGMSRDLMEDYLYIKDGKAKRFQSVPDYDKKTYAEIFENRDPRLSQTYMYPTFISPSNNKHNLQKLGAGGYPQIKFYPRSADQISWNKSYVDLPIIRYAEILLIYAEAQAEMGKLTQQDVDKTINLIRTRAGVPTALLSDWLADIDPVQNNRYANVSSSQKGAVLEIRRERRIEMACEGKRYGDLERWKCCKILEKAPEGIYVPALGGYDLTGDGKNDIAIVQSEADKAPFENDESIKTIYVLDNTAFTLTNGTSGYIVLKVQLNKWTFKEPQYYYTPLDQQDMLDNKNLKQNKYWVGVE